MRYIVGLGKNAIQEVDVANAAICGYPSNRRPRWRTFTLKSTCTQRLDLERRSLLAKLPVEIPSDNEGQNPRSQRRKLAPHVASMERPDIRGCNSRAMVPWNTPRSDKAQAFRSSNIRWPFATLLVVGAKTLEVRNYRLQSRVASGEWMWLVETPGKYSLAATAASSQDSAIQLRPLKATMIGMVRFDDCFRCDDLAQFAQLAPFHCVCLGGPMRWDGRASMHHWVVGGVVAVRRGVLVQNRFPQDLFGFRCPIAQPDVELVNVSSSCAS